MALTSVAKRCVTNHVWVLQHQFKHRPLNRLLKVRRYRCQGKARKTIPVLSLFSQSLASSAYRVPNAAPCHLRPMLTLTLRGCSPGALQTPSPTVPIWVLGLRCFPHVMDMGHNPLGTRGGVFTGIFFLRTTPFKRTKQAFLADNALLLLLTELRLSQPKLSLAEANTTECVLAWTRPYTPLTQAKSH